MSPKPPKGKNGKIHSLQRKMPSQILQHIPIPVANLNLNDRITSFRLSMIN